MLRSIVCWVPLALCVLSGSIRAQTEAAPAWGGWEQRVRRMDLTPEQKEKVTKIFEESRKEREGIQALVRQAAVELNNLLQQPDVKEQAVLKQADKLAELRTERQKAMLRTLFKVRAELTAEQRQQLFSKQPPSPKGPRRQPSSSEATPAATRAATP